MFRALRKQAGPLSRYAASASRTRSETTMARDLALLRARRRRSVAGQTQAKFSNMAMLNPMALNPLQATPLAAPSATTEPAKPMEKLSLPQLVQGPWHVFTPIGLSVVSTCGNLCGLAAAASYDHITMRFFMVCMASGVAAFNFLMPKPLKAHQWTAGVWGSLFAVLHLVNLAILLREHDHGVNLTEEEEEIYEHGFHRFGVTPRQFTKIMQAGAKYKDFLPGEVLSEAGEPVDRVFYVVKGTCEARHPTTNTLRIEYHDDIFVGCMEPKIWQAEMQPKAWQVEHQGTEDNDRQHRLQSRRQHRDPRTMLTSAMEEKTGPRTQLVVGSSWKNTNIAGPEGCRVLSWPLAAFAATVGRDSKLVGAMEKLDEAGMACKICAGASRKALEGYREVLDTVTCEGRVKHDERNALVRYRARHAVSEEEHLRMLQQLGWTSEEFEDGFKKDTLSRRWSRA